MTAKLKPAIPAGGILAQHVDRDFTDFVTGRTVEQRLCIGVFQVGGVSSSNQEKGRVNHAAYEAIHFVEVTDQHQADKLRHLITQVRADRGLAAKQPALFDSSEAEQRESLLDMVKDWASENDVATVDLDARWLSYFGGPGYAASATVQAGSVQQLKEFALVIGAIDDGAPAEAPEAGKSPEPDEDDDTDPDADADGHTPVGGTPGFTG